MAWKEERAGGRGAEQSRGGGRGGGGFGLVCPAVSGRRVASPSRSPLRAQGRGSSRRRHGAGWCTQGGGGGGSSVSLPCSTHPPSPGAPVPCADEPRAPRLFSPHAMSGRAHALGHFVGHRTPGGLLTSFTCRSRQPPVMQGSTRHRALLKSGSGHLPVGGLLWPVCDPRRPPAAGPITSGFAIGPRPSRVMEGSARQRAPPTSR